MMLVRGSISFEGEVIGLGGAAVYVRLLDVSCSDAAACIVAEYTIETLPAGTDTSYKLNFELSFSFSHNERSYALSTHVDLDRDRKISVGDYITMENYPVSAENPNYYYEIRVLRISG